MAGINDRREYDEPVNLAFCPTCGGPLEFDDSMAEDGYKWWCSGCEGYVRDAEVQIEIDDDVEL